MIAATISSAIFLGSFLRVFDKDIVTGVIRSPNASLFDNSITLSQEWKCKVSNCSLYNVMQFLFMEIKFTFRCC